MKRILFLTSTNLACNPRCLKEVELAYELGYQVIVYEFEFNNWTKKIGAKIRSRLPNVSFNSIQTSRKAFVPWLITGIIEKTARIFYRIGWRSALLSAIATNKRSFSLYMALKRKRPAFDLIIAHNPGAFYPALWLSNKTGVPYAIDIEDFHPGELSGLVKQSVSDLMQFCLPSASYVSYASPLIQEATLQLLNLNASRAILVNNVFPVAEFPRSFNQEEMPGSKMLTLVWFSQHISIGRGLEEILPLLAKYSDRLQLTLIGNIDNQFKKDVLDKYDFIIIKDPVPQEVLNAELMKYDVGLAVESNTSEENRQICLTNKIWSYLQAGLYIWASDTSAQIKFSLQFPRHVSLFSFTDTVTFHATVKDTINRLADIRKERMKRWEINQVVSWENEKEILIKQWGITMNRK